MLRSSGLEVTGDPDVDAGGLVANDGFLYGDEDELAKKVLAYRDAGVDEIVLNITGVSAVYGPEVAVRELAVLLRHFEKAVA
jgi:hypothetical protein